MQAVGSIPGERKGHTRPLGVMVARLGHSHFRNVACRCFCRANNVRNLVPVVHRVELDEGDALGSMRTGFVVATG